MKRILISVMTAALIAALSAPVYAAFTPSAEGKAAPEFVADQGTVAVITDTNGNVVKEVPTSELRITPASQKNSAPSPETREQLAEAQQQIKDSGVLTDLTDELRGALAAAKQASGDPSVQNVRLDDLAVSDLFDVSYLVDGKVTSIGAGNKITFTFKTNLTKADLFFVLHKLKDDSWEVVDDTELADNGDLTVTAGELSPFALVVEKLASDTTQPGAPTSPKTGETTNYAYLVGTVAMLACAAFLCIKGTKRTEA